MKKKNYLNLLKKLSKSSGADKANKAKELYEKIKNEEVNICFLGGFSAGKSSLIDAIIGKKLLPSKVIPTTSHMIKIHNGSPKLKIYHKNGLEETVKLKKSFILEEKKQEEIEDISKQILDNKYEKSAIVKYEIWYPIKFLGKNACLIDSPGTNSMEAGHDDIADEILNICDIPIYLLNAQQPLTENDLTILKKLSEKVDTLFIILNKIDIIDESEQSCDSILDIIVDQLKTKANINNFYIYPVSAKYALKSNHDAIELPNKFQDFIKRLAFIIKKINKKIIYEKQKKLILQNFPDIEELLKNSNKKQEKIDDTNKIEEKKQQKEKIKEKRIKVFKIIATIVFCFALFICGFWLTYKIINSNPIVRWQYFGSTTFLSIYEKFDLKARFDNENQFLLKSIKSFNSFRKEYISQYSKNNTKIDFNNQKYKDLIYSLYYQVLTEYYIYNKKDQNYFDTFEEAKKKNYVNLISTFNYIILTGNFDLNLINKFKILLFFVPISIILFLIIISKLKKLFLFPSFVSKLLLILSFLYLFAYIYFFIFIQSYFILPFTHFVLIGFYIFILILSYFTKPYLLKREKQKQKEN